MEIRRAVPDDVDLVTPMFDRYRVWYGRDSDREGARTFLAQRLVEGESVIFIAVKSGKLAGY